MVETNILPIDGLYRPMYRKHPTDRWCLVRRGDKPVACKTPTEAKRICDEVASLLESIDNPIHLIEEPLGNIEDWRRERDSRGRADLLHVFGDETARTVHRPGKLPYDVVIERKRRRA